MDVADARAVVSTGRGLRPNPVDSDRYRVVVITTVPQTLAAFFRAQLQHVRSCGFDVAAISSPGAELDDFAQASGVPTYGVAMTREITPRRDLCSLVKLISLLVTLQPEIVHTHTPKAGLLGMLAAWLTRVRVRVYTINGLPWVTQGGLRRKLMQWAERLACKASTEVLCVSESVRSEAFAAGIAPLAKMRVLGKGGSHGVDTEHFDPRRFDETARREVRRAYDIDENATVVAYVGRFVRDKGICELIRAWDFVAARSSSVCLLLAGGADQHNPLPPELWQRITNDPRIRIVRERPEAMPRVYAAADLCVLPTHREGLSNVALEAGAMGIAIIASRVCGCSDAVLHMESGLLIGLGDVPALAAAILMLADDHDLRARMGACGRRFVSEVFSEKQISSRIVDEYRRLLGTYSQPAGAKEF